MGARIAHRCKSTHLPATPPASQCYPASWSACATTPPPPPSQVVQPRQPVSQPSSQPAGATLHAGQSVPPRWPARRWTPLAGPPLVHQFAPAGLAAGTHRLASEVLATSCSFVMMHVMTGCFRAHIKLYRPPVKHQNCRLGGENFGVEVGLNLLTMVCV